jgi:hypothetical protein
VEETKEFLGVIVTLDENRCIQLPEDVMENAGIICGGSVEVFSNNSYLFIRTIDKKCGLCGANGGNTKKVGNIEVCQTCLDTMLNSARENIEEV